MICEFNGCEGVGKTTLIKCLEEILKKGGYRVQILHGYEPRLKRLHKFRNLFIVFYWLVDRKIRKLFSIRMIKSGRDINKEEVSYTGDSCKPCRVQQQILFL